MEHNSYTDTLMEGRGYAYKKYSDELIFPLVSPYVWWRRLYRMLGLLSFVSLWLRFTLHGTARRNLGDESGNHSYYGCVCGRVSESTNNLQKVDHGVLSTLCLSDSGIQFGCLCAAPVRLPPATEGDKFVAFIRT